MSVRLKTIGYILLWVSFTLNFTSGEQRFGNFPRPSMLNRDPYIQEDIHYYGPPSDAFWDQFWNTFKYQGPLEDDPFFQPLSRPISRPILPNFDYQEQFTSPDYPNTYSRPEYQDQHSRPDYQYQYSRPEYSAPQRNTFRPIREQSSNDREDAYNKYREYFYRRYGTNFADN